MYFLFDMDGCGRLFGNVFDVLCGVASCAEPTSVLIVGASGSGEWIEDGLNI